MTVRSLGRPKWSIGLDAFRAIAMKSLVAPPLHHGRVGGRDRDPGHEVRGVLQVEVALEQASLPTQRERLGDVELVLVADPDGHVEDLEQAVTQQSRRETGLPRRRAGC